MAGRREKEVEELLHSLVKDLGADGIDPSFLSLCVGMFKNNLIPCDGLIMIVKEIVREVEEGVRRE